MSVAKTCKCGILPVMAQTRQDNQASFRLECPRCGDKGAEWRRSKAAAVQDWEDGGWRKPPAE